MKQFLILTLIAVSLGFTFAAPGLWHQRYDVDYSYLEDWTSEENNDISQYLVESLYNIIGLNKDIRNVLIQVKKINFVIKEDDCESSEEDLSSSEDNTYTVNGLELIYKISHSSLLDIFEFIAISFHIDEVKMTVDDEVTADDEIST